ncbi:MAG: transcription termination/antitermination factor NusG [Treponema sp.]|nr:transcription termination/antitermination factor NusG [Treponema sp.]MBR1714010.1 transcription termination/antitermination factor NusG [Treponema sp.]
MAKSWYIVNTYTGYENKVEQTLKLKVESGEISPDVLTSIKVPIEEVIEFVKVKNRKTGVEEEKKRTKKNKILPGYILLELDLPEIGWKDACSAIRRIRGVTGFVGTDPNVRPRPLSTSEARKLLQLAGELPGEKNVKIKQIYVVGDQVRINEGPFANFNGTVEEILAEKNKLRVLVQIFGRATSVEIEVGQVEKLVK